MENRLCDVDLNFVNSLEKIYSTQPVLTSEEFANLASCIMRQNNIKQPSNFYEALQLYFLLVCTFETLFFE